MRTRVVVIALVVLTAAVVWWVVRDDRSRFETALDSLPAETQRAAYTDWAFARSSVKGASLDEFVDAAYDADLTRASAVENVAVALESNYGISVRRLDWEIYGQSDEGSVDVLNVGDASFSKLRSTLRKLGYVAPSSSEGAWTGGEELVAGIDPSLTPAQYNVVLLEDEKLVLFSDDATYAEQAADSSSSVRDNVEDLTSRTDNATSAILWAGDQACSALAMSSADEGDQTIGEGLVDDAGGVSPLTGLLMAREDSGRVTVVMGFENDDQAKDNLQPRTDLASGDAPGLGGSFRDRFSIKSAKADDEVVVLDLKPATDEDELFSSISSGPVLFATC